MDAFTSVSDTVEFIRSRGDTDHLELRISDSLQDPVGMNKAIILDAVLAKGLFPDGFEQNRGYRIYRYRREVDIG